MSLDAAFRRRLSLKKEKTIVSSQNHLFSTLQCKFVTFDSNADTRFFGKVDFTNFFAACNVSTEKSQSDPFFHNDFRFIRKLNRIIRFDCITDILCFS